MSTKLNKFKLRHFNLSSKDKNNIIDYCVSLGYIFDECPNEFKGEYPIIRKSLITKRKGFVQKIKGVLWIVYNTKRENLSEAIKINKTLIEKGVSNDKRLIRFLTGITDFEYINNYENK